MGQENAKETRGSETTSNFLFHSSTLKNYTKQIFTHRIRKRSRSKIPPEIAHIAPPENMVTGRQMPFDAESVYEMIYDSDDDCCVHLYKVS